MSLAISIVAYHNGEELKKAIECVLQCSLDFKLYLVDNSATDELKSIAIDPRVIYIFNNANLGYGAGHNVALRRSLADGTRYHLVMNPDISFQGGTLENILSFMERNQDVGSLMPKINYDDGRLQRLCKLLPTPGDLIFRRFFGRTSWAKGQNKKYELHNFNYDFMLDSPCLSGCFMFIRVSVLEQAGIFDDRFFMYLEDYDLTRRINQIARTVVYPDISIVHGYDRGSYKKLNLLKMHVISAIKYFNKWGWWRDEEREMLNEKVLETIATRH